MLAKGVLFETTDHHVAKQLPSESLPILASAAGERVIINALRDTTSTTTTIHRYLKCTSAFSRRPCSNPT